MSGSFNGKPYVLYYVSTVFGIWYSGKLFKNNGWAPAEDLGRVHQALRRDQGQGDHPVRATRGRTPPTTSGTSSSPTPPRSAAPDVLKNIDNLEDGAWQADAVKQAAAAWAEIGAKYMNKSFEGLKHTDVQLQQNQYKVAFYPSGDWLEGEQSQGHPGRLRIPADAGAEPVSRRQDVRRGGAGRPRVRGTSSRRRARTRGAAWSTCGRCCPRPARRASPRRSRRRPW